MPAELSYLASRTFHFATLNVKRLLLGLLQAEKDSNLHLPIMGGPILPIELPAIFDLMVPPVGIEPTTYGI